MAEMACVDVTRCSLSDLNPSISSPKPSVLVSVVIFFSRSIKDVVAVWNYEMYCVKFWNKISSLSALLRKLIFKLENLCLGHLHFK